MFETSHSVPFPLKIVLIYANDLYQNEILRLMYLISSITIYSFNMCNINMIINTLETKISRKLVQSLKLLESITTIICQYIFLRNRLNLHNNVTVTWMRLTNMHIIVPHTSYNQPTSACLYSLLLPKECHLNILTTYFCNKSISFVYQLFSLDFPCDVMSCFSWKGIFVIFSCFPSLIFLEKVYVGIYYCNDLCWLMERETRITDKLR